MDAAAAAAAAADAAALKAAVAEYSRDKARAQEDIGVAAFVGALAGYGVGRAAGAWRRGAGAGEGPGKGGAGRHGRTRTTLTPYSPPPLLSRPAPPHPSANAFFPGALTAPAVSSFRAPRTGPAALLGAAAAIVGAGAAAGYVARVRNLHELFDPSYLADYGAPPDVIASLAGPWGVPQGPPAPPLDAVLAGLGGGGGGGGAR
jgi:hypothetical protein